MDVYAQSNNNNRSVLKSVHDYRFCRRQKRISNSRTISFICSNSEIRWNVNNNEKNDEDERKLVVLCTAGLHATAYSNG